MQRYKYEQKYTYRLRRDLKEFTVERDRHLCILERSNGTNLLQRKLLLVVGESDEDGQNLSEKDSVPEVGRLLESGCCGLMRFVFLIISSLSPLVFGTGFDGYMEQILKTY